MSYVPMTIVLSKRFGSEHTHRFSSAGKRCVHRCVSVVNTYRHRSMLTGIFFQIDIHITVAAVPPDDPARYCEHIARLP